MMKKIAFSALLILFLILTTGFLAEAGTARFPVAVKWNTLGQGQVYTDIYIVNLKDTSVDVNLDLYSKDGALSSCGVMPTVTIPANGTKHINPSGCFAIELGVSLDFDGIGQIIASSNNIGIYWRIYNQTTLPLELIDHGKEIPTGTVIVPAASLLLLP
jgi:hypothetical protein